MKWTHPSVVQLAGQSDPIEVIQRAARDMVLDAVENGWTGPPFDPFALAELLNYRSVPSQVVADAMLTPEGRGFRIDFNPNQSPRRIRFSIAHEIAHTLFPDFREQVHHRLRRAAMRDDEWQLEMLCNIAAGEILLPAGELTIESGRRLAIDDVIRFRDQFDVSIEAVLLRVVRLERRHCAVFVASPLEARYRLDYSVETHRAAFNLRSGLILPENTRVAHCRALGYTAKADESWINNQTLHIECVAIPGYTGHQEPRVAGIIYRKADRAEGSPRITYLTGDATKPQGGGKKVIAHIVNDATPRWGGGGFANAIQRIWPVVQKDFEDWAKRYPKSFRLGESHPTQLTDDVALFSMIAQHGYGPSRLPRIRYHHLRSCLVELAQFAKSQHASVHVPRIGCGEARGNWLVVQDLLLECLSDNGVDVVVYDLPTKSASRDTRRQPSLFAKY